MTNYTKLVEALRFCSGTHTKPTKCPDYGEFCGCGGKCLDKHLTDAAAAIEALIGTVGDLQAIRERLEEENDALRLEPKRGEIVRCRECRWGHLCVMGQHLGLDGFCSKGERKVQE